MDYHIINLETFSEDQPIDRNTMIFSTDSFQEALYIFEKMKAREKACLIFRQSEPEDRRELVSFRRVVVSDKDFPERIETRQMIVSDMTESESKAYKAFYQKEAEISRVVEIGELKKIFINGEEGRRSWIEKPLESM